nr:MAG TPA: hypothetical protein [Caudoviricetes sp.]
MRTGSYSSAYGRTSRTTAWAATNPNSSSVTCTLSTHSLRPQ